MNSDETLEPITLAVLLMIAKTIVKMDRDAGVMAGQEFKKRLQAETEDWLRGETPLQQTQKKYVRSRLALFCSLVERSAVEYGIYDAEDDLSIS